MEDQDLDIEDILSRKKAKKKVDGKAKGNRTELQLCKLLTDHFEEDFTRSVGSGNRWAQVNLTEAAKQVFTGDICVPEGFLWVFESKGGYEKEIDLNSVLDGAGIPMINKFMEQVGRDAVQCGRKPLVCWKRSRKPWLAMLREADLKPHKATSFAYRIHYADWVIVTLDELLKATPRKFWFK